MTAVLTVTPLGDTRYTVKSGENTYTVDAGVVPPVCSCESYRYFPKARPCKHGRKVLDYRAEPQAALLDGLSEKDTLDLVDPSKGKGYKPYIVVPVDDDDRAVALAALAQWEKLHAAKQQPHGYMALVRAAWATKNGMEWERVNITVAAEYFAEAAAIVHEMAARGRVAV